MPPNYGMSFDPIEHSMVHVRKFRPFLRPRFELWFSVGVPQVHHFGQEGLHNVLVIDLLGPNLEDLFDMCGRKFTIKTVCMAAKQMVSSLDIVLYLHVCVRMYGIVIILSFSRLSPISYTLVFSVD